jgi:hypothetical protein
MGQATRRKLALGLRSAEASLAATRGRSRWRRYGAGARETQRRRLRSALGALDLLSLAIGMMIQIDGFYNL